MANCGVARELAALAQPWPCAAPSALPASCLPVATYYRVTYWQEFDCTKSQIWMLTSVLVLPACNPRPKAPRMQTCRTPLRYLEIRFADFTEEAGGVGQSVLKCFRHIFWKFHVFAFGTRRLCN